jgi:hypothetical protein
MVKVTADNVNVYHVEWRDARRQQGVGRVWSVRAAGGATGGMPKGPAAAGVARAGPAESKR